MSAPENKFRASLKEQADGRNVTAHPPILRPRFIDTENSAAIARQREGSCVCGWGGGGAHTRVQEAEPAFYADAVDEPVHHTSFGGCAISGQGQRVLEYHSRAGQVDAEMRLCQMRALTQAQQRIVGLMPVFESSFIATVYDKRLPEKGVRLNECERSMRCTDVGSVSSSEFDGALGPCPKCSAFLRIM